MIRLICFSLVAVLVFAARGESQLLSGRRSVSISRTVEFGNQVPASVCKPADCETTPDIESNSVVRRRSVSRVRRFTFLQSRRVFFSGGRGCCQ